MKSYSPVDNVRAQAYPHILAIAGLHDPRVGGLVHDHKRASSLCGPSPVRRALQCCTVATAIVCHVGMDTGRQGRRSLHAHVHLNVLCSHALLWRRPLAASLHRPDASVALILSCAGPA